MRPKLPPLSDNCPFPVLPHVALYLHEIGEGYLSPHSTCTDRNKSLFPCNICRKLIPTHCKHITFVQYFQCNDHNLQNMPNHLQQVNAWKG